MTTYLGIVDEVRTAVSGPKAFLRPVLKVESEKSKWEAIETDEFPNRGLASWWKPPSNVLNGSAWLFRVHGSETFDQENQYHNMFNVTDPADQATELIDASAIHTEEDLRTELCSHGLAIRPPLTGRVVIRFAGDKLVGPVHGRFHDGRLYLPDETLNSLLAIGRTGTAEALAKYDGHLFLPPQDWLQKIGEVDFSPDSVFLKRMLKEIRSKDLASMKLTDGLVKQLVGGAADTGLTVLEKQRLERLKTWTARVEEDVTLTEEVIGEILQLPAVRKEVTAALERAKGDAKKEVDQELRDELQKITTARTDLSKLADEREKVLAELAESRRQQLLLANTLDSTIEARVRSVMEKPVEFLAETALMRAALSLGTKNTTTSAHTARQPSMVAESPRLDLEKAAQLLSAFFGKRGFRPCLPLALHGAFLAGSIPLLYGRHAREALSLYSSVVTGGSILWVPITPSYLEPADLFLSRMSASQPGTANLSGLSHLLRTAQASNAMHLVVCEGVNRCFLQSAVEPVFRHVVDRNQGVRTSPLISLCSDGTDQNSINWPSNVLLAGTIVDERSLYPLDVSIWDVANWILTDPYYEPGKRDLDGIPDAWEYSGAEASAWSNWQPRPENPTGDLKVFLRLIGDKLLLDSSFYSASARLYQVLHRLDPKLEPQDILLQISKLTLLPRCTKQIGRLKELLEVPPFELWEQIEGADILQRLSGSSMGDTNEKEIL